MIRIIAPSALAASFFAFIEQKSRENVPKVKEVSSIRHDDFLMQYKLKAFSIFDALIADGLPVKTALSKTNYALKAAGFANSSYDNTVQVLSKSGRLKQKTK